jgi:hypothetical protein
VFSQWRVRTREANVAREDEGLLIEDARQRHKCRRWKKGPRHDAIDCSF